MTEEQIRGLTWAKIWEWYVEPNLSTDDGGGTAGSGSGSSTKSRADTLDETMAAAFSAAMKFGGNPAAAAAAVKRSWGKPFTGVPAHAKAALAAKAKAKAKAKPKGKRKK